MYTRGEFLYMHFGCGLVLLFGNNSHFFSGLIGHSVTGIEAAKQRCDSVETWMSNADRCLGFIHIFYIFQLSHKPQPLVPHS
jgi:hypothetical protein